MTSPRTDPLREVLRALTAERFAPPRPMIPPDPNAVENLAELAQAVSDLSQEKRNDSHP